jgi:hypothetical protein
VGEGLDGTYWGGGGAQMEELTGCEAEERGW